MALINRSPRVVVAGCVVAICLISSSFTTSTALADASGGTTSTPPPVIVSMNMVTRADSVDWKTRQPQTQTATLDGPATLNSGIWLSWADSEYDLHIGATPEQPLHLGTYTNVGTHARRTVMHDLDADLQGFSFQQVDGRIEVLDLAAADDGILTRFDIVYELSDSSPGESVFGEIRMNEPNSFAALSATAEHLHWPRVARGGPSVQAVDDLRNMSDQPLAVEGVKVRGDAARSFNVSSDTCTGHTLAPGADCSITVGFDPARPGPQAATLTISTLQGVLPVDLTGSTPLGRSSLTTSGDDVIDQGSRHVVTPLVGFGLGPFPPSLVDPTPPAHTYRWVEDPAVFKAPAQGLDLTLTSQHGRIRTGRRPISTYTPSNALLGYSTYRGACHGYEGSMNVRAFTLDAEDQPSLARIDFTERCRPSSPQTEPWGTITGLLRFQDRKDSTPPRAPTRLSVKGHTVHWRNAHAKDLRSTIVRISTGGRLTPTTGRALSAGRATSAKLPTLRPGQRYTIAAFSIDRTGNTSVARTRTFTS